MRILAFIGGAILLLPGACSIVFIGLSMSESSVEPVISILWILCFAISLGGVLMIIWALKKK